jgi:hypothetical protein
MISIAMQGTEKARMMKRMARCGLAAAMATSLLSAEPDATEAVKGAVAKLVQQGNYTWKTTMAYGSFAGSVEGKTLKDGLLEFTSSFGDNTMQVFLKDGKGAIKGSDEEWQSMGELAAAAGSAPGPRQFLVRRLESFKTPAAEAADALSKVQALRKEGDAFAGEVTEAGAKDLFTYGARRGKAPEPKNAKGTVKFWVKDGLLAKYELKLQATVNSNGEDHELERITTVEFKDIGTTRIDVPEEAGRKLSMPVPTPPKATGKS